MDYPTYQEAIAAAVAGLVSALLGYFFGKRRGNGSR